MTALLFMEHGTQKLLRRPPRRQPPTGLVLAARGPGRARTVRVVPAGDRPPHPPGGVPPLGQHGGRLLHGARATQLLPGAQRRRRRHPLLLRFLLSVRRWTGTVERRRAVPPDRFGSVRSWGSSALARRARPCDRRSARAAARAAGARQHERAGALAAFRVLNAATVRRRLQSLKPTSVTGWNWKPPCARLPSVVPAKWKWPSLWAAACCRSASARTLGREQATAINGQSTPGREPRLSACAVVVGGGAVDARSMKVGIRAGAGAATCRSGARAGSAPRGGRSAHCRPTWWSGADRSGQPSPRRRTR